MSIYLKSLVPGSDLTGSAATYYTAGTGITARIGAATVCNTDSTARTVTVYIVPNGGTAGITNICIDAKSLQANETYTCPELIGKTIPPGATIQALASSAAVVAFQVSGIEQTQP